MFIKTVINYVCDPRSNVQEIIVMVCCFLCEADWEGGTDKVKRRKFPGSTTEDVLKIIETFAWESYSAFVSFGNDSYILYKCKQRVESLPGLLEKAKNEMAELLNYICRHAAVQGPGRKRPDGSPAETEHLSLKLGASPSPLTKGTRQIRDNEDFKFAVCSAILILFLFVFTVC